MRRYGLTVNVVVLLPAGTTTGPMMVAQELPLVTVTAVFAAAIPVNVTVPVALDPPIVCDENNPAERMSTGLCRSSQISGQFSWR